MAEHPLKAPNCLNCQYYKVTWDKNFPRGCTMFGVKGREMPSTAVFKATGKHCPSFVKSSRIKE
ncbi:MAG TPA: hypothetical protein DCO79_05405 [Spirochaeta sp.]|nr:hypothetical protein [Spirochaeta sp.]